MSPAHERSLSPLLFSHTGEPIIFGPAAEASYKWVRDEVLAVSTESLTHRSPAFDIRPIGIPEAFDH